MTDARWRRKAKDLLFDYTAKKRRLRQAEQDVIYGTTRERDHRYRRGGVPNPTLVKAELLDSPELNQMRREIAAVEGLLQELQTERRIDQKQRTLLELVYIRNSHCLYGAAALLEISERTAKRWNTRALENLARRMGWLD